MEQKSMTALISAFARGYHARQSGVKVYDDYLADKMLTVEEMHQIAAYMSDGIDFFNPGFHGTSEEALRWIVDNQLSPTPLGRAAWSEKALQTAVRIGATQYLVVAAGYDTFAYRQPDWAAKLRIFELDHPVMSADKHRRVEESGVNKPDNLCYIAVDLASESLCEKLRCCEAYDETDPSFWSMLGICYYLSKEDFKGMVQDIAKLVPAGSAIAFDHPDEYAYTQRAGERARKQSLLASGAKEAMRASYSCDEVSRLLSNCGFLIYEYLTPDEITEQYFADYNVSNPNHPMAAFDNVNYCLAVKR